MEKRVGARRHSEASETPIRVASVFFLRIFIKLYMENLYIFPLKLAKKRNREAGAWLQA